ncbi:hypothetical protein [Candidatus Methanoperedens nitratireducens]|uniref:Uncharacterized protein n=1 Tax=Candidatus Methanoperedens nitratireducens TaxID=1392998 RepID=A0A284VPL1_9EURY|nr:hypothetical protein [Candidatus Methanoperedens nitroreducens]SNQ61192.1 hypothetical protein MNV_250009 [Candidatus Methanoperedens nitroreducens]
MKVAKKGGRAKSSKMMTIQRSICDSDMDCAAKELYPKGASSMLGLLISTGMPPSFLDDLEETIREAKGEVIQCSK